MKTVLLIIITLIVTFCTISKSDDTSAVHDKEEVKSPTLECFGDKYKAIESANFIGEWVRGEPSDSGYYSERLIVNEKSYRYYEDGTLVMEGPTVVRNNILLINPKENKSRYYNYSKVGGCWGGLRNSGNSLDLFGNVKGMLSFDRKNNSEQTNAPDEK